MYRFYWSDFIRSMESGSSDVENKSNNMKLNVQLSNGIIIVWFHLRKINVALGPAEYKRPR